MKLYKSIKAFSLIEILVWIMIISIVIIWWFQSLTAVTIWKVRIIQQTDIQKESFYFTEKLFEMIKKWGTLDYEEYFNRKVIWNTTFNSWHFDIPSWFGNFWYWGTLLWVYWWNMYYCISWDWNKISYWSGCTLSNNFLADFVNYPNVIVNTSNWTFDVDNSWEHQRYWEYNLQFIDYNSNFDDDQWDENWDTFLNNDDDDEYLWNWPEVFTTWESMPELYLISWDKLNRTLFRWNVKLDENAWGNTCDIATATWSGCIWTIEYLKLEWVDYWQDHILGWAWRRQWDWVIDTWLIHDDFQLWGNVAWKVWVKWISLFPETINVTEFQVRAYPNKDLWLAWNANDVSLNVSPYIILNLKLKPSWKSRSKIKWAWEELEFSMTINLSEIYSQ